VILVGTHALADKPPVAPGVQGFRLFASQGHTANSALQES
jgi:hypothetical protein